MKYNMCLALVLFMILILFGGCYHNTITPYHANKISYISVRKYNYIHRTGYNLSNEMFRINSIIDISKLCTDLKSIKRPPNIYGCSPRYRLDFKDASNKLLFAVKILGGNTTIFIYDISGKKIDAGQNITMIKEFFRILKNKSPEEYKKLEKRLRKYHIAEKFLD